MTPSAYTSTSGETMPGRAISGAMYEGVPTMPLPVSWAVDSVSLTMPKSVR
jgi:hypothetical protein